MGCGGGGGIRTHGTVTSTPVFKTGALNRSATPPVVRVAGSSTGRGGRVNPSARASDAARATRDAAFGPRGYPANCGDLWGLGRGPALAVGEGAGALAGGGKVR